MFQVRFEVGHRFSEEQMQGTGKRIGFRRMDWLLLGMELFLTYQVVRLDR